MLRKLTAVCGLAVAAGLLAAGPQARAAVPASCTAALTNDCLFTTLTDMGLSPRALSKGYLVTFKQDTWTINVQFVLSPNLSRLGLNANLGMVEGSQVTAAQWQALMEANGDIDPTAFYYDATQKKLYLHRTLENRYLTAAILREQLDTFSANMRSTAKLWAFTK